MTTKTSLKIDVGLALWTVEAATRLLATFSFVQGVNIIIGGEARWAEPHYSTALSVPGAPQTWGYILMTCGAIALGGSLLGRTRAVAFGSGLCSVWCAFFALSVLRSVSENPTAATTPLVTYAALTVAFALVGTTYWQSRHG